MSLSEVTIYTDGASSQSVGPGGWAAILQAGGAELEISGFAEETTNQRMELTAALEALRHLTRPCRVTVFSDSAYLVNCFRDGWYVKWRDNGWYKSGGLANRDLWQELVAEVERHRHVTFVHVKGHSGHALNERADRLAVEAKKGGGAVLSSD